ncbi:MAG: hypothetical protein ACFCGT_17105 [Sandaracinaceae bacterium]
MLRTLRLLPLLLAVGVMTLGVSACGESTAGRGGDDAGPIRVDPDLGPLPEPDLGRPLPGTLTASPASMTFSHQARVTPCPQDIGDITLVNGGAGPVDFTASVPASGELEVSPSRGTVPGGGTATVSVSFSCRIRMAPPFRLSQVVTIDHDGTGGAAAVTVVGDIN